MVGQAERRRLVVSTDVLGDSGRNTGDPGLLPRRALGNSDEGLDGGRNVIGCNDPARTRAVSVGIDRPVIGGSDASGLIDGRVGVGIRAWRQRTGHDLGAVIVDRLVERLKNRTGSVEKLERMGQYPMLKLGVSRLAERSSEGEVTPEASGRSRVLDLVPLRAEGDGRQSGGFEDVRQRTHGTRTEGSNRGEQDYVDTLLLQPRTAGRT